MNRMRWQTSDPVLEVRTVTAFFTILGHFEIVSCDPAHLTVGEGTDDGVAMGAQQRERPQAVWHRGSAADHARRPISLSENGAARWANGASIPGGQSLQ
jgi:hypothetical protein